MKADAPQPVLLLSARVYQALLVAYPVEFRREYGRHMLQVFRDVGRDAYRQGGTGGLLVWWAAALFDLLHTAFAERRKVTFTMSTFKLSHWSGWLCIFAGLFFAASSLSQLQPGSHYSFFGVYQLSIYALVPGMALIALGLIGMFLRYRATLVLFGRIFLTTAILGAAIGSLGWLVTLGGGDAYLVFMAGWLLHLIGASVFAGFAMTTQLFGKLSWVMLPGSALPLTLAVLSFGSQQEPNGVVWGSFLMLLLIGLGWMLTGVALNKQTQPSTAVVVPSV